MTGWLVVAIAVISLALGAVIAGWVAHIKAGQRERERQRAERELIAESWHQRMEASKRARQEAVEQIRDEVEQMDPDALAAAVDAGIDQFRTGGRVVTGDTTDTDGAGNPAE